MVRCEENQMCAAIVAESHPSQKRFYSSFAALGFYCRSVTLRDGLRRKEEISFFASPALALQLASSPRDRAGLLPPVPLTRDWISVRHTFPCPQKSLPCYVWLVDAESFVMKRIRCGAADGVESHPQAKLAKAWGTHGMVSLIGRAGEAAH
jgi:hypothetical protein